MKDPNINDVLVMAQSMPTEHFVGEEQEESTWTPTVRDVQVMLWAMDELEKALLLLKKLNTAFYADGSSKALKPVMAETKPLIMEIEGRK